MRIDRLALYFPPEERMEGWSPAALELTRAQIQRGHTVRVIAAGRRWREEEEVGGVPVVRVFGSAPPLFHLEALTYGLASFLEVHREPPDLVHAHDYTPALYARLHTLLRDPVPLALHSHGLHITWARRGLFKLLARGKSGPLGALTDLWPRLYWGAMAHRNADLIFAVSEHHRQEIEELYRVDPERIHVAYSGVDARRFRPETFPLRRSLGIEDDAQVVLMPGADERKGIHILLPLYRSLAERHRSLHLIVLGTDRPALERRYGPLPSTVHCIPLMPFQRMHECYNAADIVVLPSLYEGMPKTLLEAMACAKPVVASRILGIPELVEEGRTGLLADPSRPPEMEGALETLLQDPALARRMGDEGRRRILERFTWDQVAERVEAGYRRLLE